MNRLGYLLIGIVVLFVLIWGVSMLVYPGHVWGQPLWSEVGSWFVREEDASTSEEETTNAQTEMTATTDAPQPDATAVFESAVATAVARQMSVETSTDVDPTTPEPTVTPIPTGTPRPTSTPTPTREQECTMISDRQVLNRDAAISADDGWIHVQLWAPGHPEYESVLEADAYSKDPTVAGWVWFYSAGCSIDDMMTTVDNSITRRQAEGANNGGYQSPDWFFDQGWLSQ